MFIFQKVADLQAFLHAARAEKKSIGFVPTMGALHAGHLDLVQKAKSACDIAVVSIFVNPTQFNDRKDLEVYPRTPDQDVAALISAGCDALLMPPVDEIYPPGIDLTVQLDFGPLEKVMEGVFRPGHFKGMATVVKRLLDIVEPDQLLMGQKDFQQLSIVRDMLRQLDSPIRLVMCTTVREPDGLAMSSRNTRLSPEMRRISPVIYQVLREAKSAFQEESASKIEARAMQKLAAAGLQPEYFELVDGITLQAVENWQDATFVVACTTAFAGAVRLIDNIVIKGSE
jgi:pantoate--beta-alanine ligase